MPYSPGLYGYLTERGTLFYNGKIPNATHIGRSPFRAGSALEMDWKGRLLWEVKHPDHHHDGMRLRNGNVLLICSTPLPDEIVRKVQGGRPGTEYDNGEYDNGKMNGDYLVEMTTKGEIVWEWRTWDHMDPADYPITAVQDNRDEWTHANGFFEMPDGNILLSFRNVSTLIMINRATGEVHWRLGAPPLSGQHAPYILTNGPCPGVRQRPASIGRELPVLARAGNRSGDQEHRVEIPGDDLVEFLQPQDFQCPTVTEWEHSHR
jgi:hypothetical protein